jgi:prepilin-type N-terminal cleavage/methylation domain-containing protein
MNMIPTERFTQKARVCSISASPSPVTREQAHINPPFPRRSLIDGTGSDGRLFPGVARSGGVVIGRSKGFTLVEVIVVLVILAILAAIAIPALTGDIDKAEDKKWIAQSREYFIACRTELSEAYAENEWEASPAAIALLQNGDSDYSTMKLWTIQSMLSGYQRVADLLGRKYPQYASYPGTWGFNFVADKADSDARPWTTDGFYFNIYPDGWGSNKKAIFVTYRISHISGVNSAQTFFDVLEGEAPDSNSAYAKYESTAGYEVYHLTIS